MLNTWKQSFKRKKPRISLLNEESLYQPARVIPFSRFPIYIKNMFPRYSEAEAQNAALVRLLFSNSGDADGYISIEAVNVINLPDWKASYYTQKIIGAKSYCIHEIVLRSIPDLPESKEIHLKVKLNWGGAASQPESIVRTIGVSLKVVAKDKLAEPNALQ
jgi:hypothetical protein